MRAEPLPQNSTLAGVRERAAELLREVAAGDGDALALARAFHPRFDPAGFSLADAEVALARRHGFPSWARLVAHVEAATEFARSPCRVDGSRHDPAGEFLHLACLTYGIDSPQRRERARDMLRAHPELAATDIYTAAAAGAVDVVRRCVAAEPALVHRRGGPHAWEPLLYAVYSRVESDSASDVVGVLLDAGADPNAGFLWEGLVPPFTALTGVFGEGEQGATNQPPHRDCEAIAALLLDAGADPNDEQTLYNRQFGPSTDHLRILLSRGLGSGDGGPWRRRFPDALKAPPRLLELELLKAAAADRLDRVQLLVEHGAPLEARDEHGRTALERAVRRGHTALADWLIARGAEPPRLTPLDRLVAAVLAGDAATARRLASDEAGALAEAREVHRDLVRRAAGHGRSAAVRLAVELGFDVNARDRGTALHAAAWSGDLDLARALIELGADPHVEDEEHRSTPRGWAEFNGQTAMAEYLASVARG